MRFRYAWTACLSFLVVQMTPGGRADFGVATKDVAPEALESHSKRTIVMHRIDFESETFRIAPEAAPVFDEAIQLLEGTSDHVAVVIDQGADADRSKTFRLFTTRQRAKAVRRYLVDHGVAPSRVSLPPVAVAIPPGSRSTQSPHVVLHVE